jgi:hypothetical protein
VWPGLCLDALAMMVTLPVAKRVKALDAARHAFAAHTLTCRELDSPTVFLSICSAVVCGGHAGLVACGACAGGATASCATHLHIYVNSALRLAMAWWEGNLEQQEEATGSSRVTV